MRRLLLCLLMFAGCASEPTKLSSAVAVPPERLMAPTLAPGQESSTLVVVADRGAYMTTATVIVQLDGKRVAVLREGEMVTLQIPPGERQIATDYDWNLGRQKPKTSEFIARPGRRTVYRVGFESVGGTPSMTLARELGP